MSQYDVYPGRRTNTYILDVQSDLIDGLPTRIVVPLYAETPTMRKIKRLHPVFVIDGRNFVMATHQMASVPKSELTTAKANLTAHHDDISRAVYMAFQGFLNLNSERNRA